MYANLIQSFEGLKSKNSGFPEKKEFCCKTNVEVLPEFPACWQDLTNYPALKIAGADFINLSLCVYPVGSVSLENSDTLNKACNADSSLKKAENYNSLLLFPLTESDSFAPSLLPFLS